MMQTRLLKLRIIGWIQQQLLREKKYRLYLGQMDRPPQSAVAWQQRWQAHFNYFHAIYLTQNSSKWSNIEEVILSVALKCLQWAIEMQYS